MSRRHFFLGMLAAPVLAAMPPALLKAEREKVLGWLMASSDQGKSWHSIATIRHEDLRPNGIYPTIKGGRVNAGDLISWRLVDDDQGDGTIVSRLDL